MIPKKTQSRPNVWPQHHCPTCDYRLEDGTTKVAHVTLRRWNFCPICGEEIEWEKVKPVVWKPLDCEVCGKKLIIETQFGPMASADYIEGPVCRECQIEHCRTTNCLGCDRGEYPYCKYEHLKALALVPKEEPHEDND